MILNNLYKKFRYYFWHNPIMDKLEGYASSLSNWFWRKRWGDRNFINTNITTKKKDHLTKKSSGLRVACEGSLLS